MLRMDLRLALPPTARPKGVGELTLAATLFAPEGVAAQDVQVLICWQGGSYGRDYWDVRLPGRTGYSIAEHMTARGFIVIAADPLGVGDSGRPEDGTLCTYEALADAAHGAVQVIRAGLLDGTLAVNLPPVASPRIIGVGHSIGGGLVTIQQARWGSYDAIAVLGFTHGAKDRAVESADDPTFRATAVEQAKGLWGDQCEARYGVVDKSPHQVWLNGPDAPTDIVEADNANSVVWAAEPYVDALHVGFTGAYAAPSRCAGDDRLRRVRHRGAPARRGCVLPALCRHHPVRAGGQLPLPQLPRRQSDTLEPPRRVGDGGRSSARPPRIVLTSDCSNRPLWPRSHSRKLNRTGFTSPAEPVQPGLDGLSPSGGHP